MFPQSQTPGSDLRLEAGGSRRQTGHRKQWNRRHKSLKPWPQSIETCFQRCFVIPTPPLQQPGHVAHLLLDVSVGFCTLLHQHCNHVSTGWETGKQACDIGLLSLSPGPIYHPHLGRSWHTQAQSLYQGIGTTCKFQAVHKTPRRCPPRITDK